MGRVNLRSDTQTLPTQGMLEAMGDAALGDDTYREDPTVSQLEERVAEMFSRNAALLLLSGTMANLVALMVHCRPGDEIFVDEDAHVVRSEAGGYAGVAGVVATFIEGERGHPTPEGLRSRLHQSDVHRPNPRLLWLENTHNRAGGTIMSQEVRESLLSMARDAGLAAHLDGARVFNAATALDLPVAELGRGFDSVYMDLTKGLSCPLGALLVGDDAWIEEARQKRRMIGGGMRQAGSIAACGLFALDTMVERLSDDHQMARRLAEQIAEIEGCAVDPSSVETNIVFVDVTTLGRSTDVARGLSQMGVIVSDYPPSQIRLVAHRQIGIVEADTAVSALQSLAADMISDPSP